MSEASTQGIRVTGTITFFADSTVPVVWTSGDSAKGKRCQGKSGEFLTFKFDGPAEVVEAVLLIGPLAASKPRSPFDQPNPVKLVRDNVANYFRTPHISDGIVEGRWGFSIAFMTEEGSNKDSKFYFLPDPELAVGSGPEGTP